MKKFYITLAALIAAAAVWNIFLYLNPDKGTPLNYLFNAFYALIFLFGAVVASRGHKKYLLFYSLALTSYSIGLFVWTFYNLVLKVEIPYPGTPDIFFVLFQLLLVIGFILMVNDFGGRFKLRSIIEFLLVFGIIFGLLYSFLNLGRQDESLSILAKGLNFYYPMFDSILVALAVAGIRTEMGSLHPILLVFAFASLTMAAADTSFTYLASAGSYWNGDIADSLYAASGSLFAIGITYIVSSLAENNSGGGAPLPKLPGNS